MRQGILDGWTIIEASFAEKESVKKEKLIAALSRLDYAVKNAERYNGNQKAAQKAAQKADADRFVTELLAKYGLKYDAIKQNAQIEAGDLEPYARLMSMAVMAIMIDNQQKQTKKDVVESQKGFLERWLEELTELTELKKISPKDPEFDSCKRIIHFIEGVLFFNQIAGFVAAEKAIEFMDAQNPSDALKHEIAEILYVLNALYEGQRALKDRCIINETFETNVDGVRWKAMQLKIEPKAVPLHDVEYQANYIFQFTSAYVVHRDIEKKVCLKDNIRIYNTLSLSLSKLPKDITILIPLREKSNAMQGKYEAMQDKRNPEKKQSGNTRPSVFNIAAHLLRSHAAKFLLDPKKIFISTSLGTCIALMSEHNSMVKAFVERVPFTLLQRLVLNHMPEALYINSDVSRFALSAGSTVYWGIVCYDVYRTFSVQKPGSIDKLLLTACAANAFNAWSLYQGNTTAADMKVQIAIGAVAMVCGAYCKYAGSASKGTQALN